MSIPRPHDATTLARSQQDIARVGHDNGWLVLRFERRLASAPALVRQALEASQQVDWADRGYTRALLPADGTIRWEVAEVDPGSLLALTTWIDGDDIDLAACTGTAYHRYFERLVHSIEPAASRPLSAAASLTKRYSSAVATALADTD